MSFKIVTDSSADLTEISGVDFANVPLKIITDHHEYVDTPDLDVAAMISDLKVYKGRSRTSCPNPSEYLAAFGESENVFCVTITGGLSGSYNAAAAAGAEYTANHPERRVFVIDSLSTGPENALLIEKLAELISKYGDFDRIKEEICDYHMKTRLLFSLESMHNLSRNGRVSPIVAKLCGALGIRVIGRASDVGTLETTDKARGAHNTLTTLLKNMLKEGFDGGSVRIHHVNNPDAAALLCERILEIYPTAPIVISSARALCSFYAEEGGILVGFEI